MKKEIPELDTLLDGINDPEATLHPTQTFSDTTNDTASLQKEVTSEVVADSSEGNEVTEKYWTDFMSYLSSTDQRSEKDDRLVCKLDRDLADSLDDCDIGNRCRSDLVNAIIRAFFGTFMPRLIMYRREKKSLFQNYPPQAT